MKQKVEDPGFVRRILENTMRYGKPKPAVLE
jgi:hypothetical protein